MLDLSLRADGNWFVSEAKGIIVFHRQLHQFLVHRGCCARWAVSSSMGASLFNLNTANLKFLSYHRQLVAPESISGKKSWNLAYGMSRPQQHLHAGIVSTDFLVMYINFEHGADRLSRKWAVTTRWVWAARVSRVIELFYYLHQR